MNRAMWILGGALVVLLIVLVLLLATGAGDDTTTTTAAVAAPSSTTTEEPPTTTTTAGVVTTSTTIATTTTSIVETTTTTVLPGTWAEKPLVVAGFGALGWWNGSGWVQVDPGGSLPVVGGEDYQIAALDLSAVTTGGPQELVCGPIDNSGVVLADEELLGAWPGPYGVAISAPWELTPHTVESLEDDGTFAAYARDLLADRGLDVEEPVVKQLLRVDLEGDGVNEILVIAEEVGGGFFPTEGDYSILFMRKLIDGSVETAVLGSAIVLDPEVDFTAGLSIGAVADLSGDGKMEIVVSSAYFEGLGVEVFEYVNDDLGPVSQISTGCGA